MRYRDEVLKRERRQAGSITAEAALGLPLFFFALLAVCRMFTCIETEYRIRTAIFEAAQEMSCSAVLMEKVSSALEDTVKASVAEAIADKSSEDKADDSARSEDDGSELDPEDEERIKDKEELLKAEEAAVTEFAGMVARRAAETAYIGDSVMSKLNEAGFSLSLTRGGTAPTGLAVESISFVGSEIEDGKVLNIRFSCKLMIPTVIMGTIGYPIKEELQYRVFSGLSVKSLLSASNPETDGNDQREVYITEKGSVYHTSLSCPSLKITTRSVLFSQVGKARSDSGARYYPCEKCAKGNAPAAVYVTPDGNRYHYRIDCSALKRSVQTVSLDSVEGRDRCKRCPDD